MGEGHIHLGPEAIVAVGAPALQHRTVCLLPNPRELRCQRAPCRAMLRIDWKSLQIRKDKSELQRKGLLPPPVQKP